MERTIDALIDSNVLIYATSGGERYTKLLSELGALGMSIISFMELCIGVRSAEEESTIASLLLDIEIVPLTQDIASAAVMSLRERGHTSLRTPHVADTVIAHTALTLGVPLVTNNPKDFQRFEGLQLLVP